MKIGIISGSIREGRKSTAVAQWVQQQGEGLDAQLEILELADFNVPLLTSATIPGGANRQYDSAEVTAWSQAIDACDAFIFVTPEYNHGVPGGLKNAFDSIYPEWAGKAVAFVSYGANGGVRATEQWRQITPNAQMFDVRGSVALSLFTDFDEAGVKSSEQIENDAKTMFEQLLALAQKLA